MKKCGNTPRKINNRDCSENYGAPHCLRSTSCREWNWTCRPGGRGTGGGVAVGGDRGRAGSGRAQGEGWQWGAVWGHRGRGSSAFVQTRQFSSLVRGGSEHPASGHQVPGQEGLSLISPVFTALCAPLGNGAEGLSPGCPTPPTPAAPRKSMSLTGPCPRDMCWPDLLCHVAQEPRVGSSGRLESDRGCGCV